jgi:hypothetical protein
VALDLPSVLDLNWLFDRLVDKNISKVYFLLCEICLGAKTFPFQFEGKSFFCTRDIAVGDALVSIGLSWAEGDSDSDFTIRPDFSNQRFDLEDVILEEEQVILNGLSDGFVFSSQCEFCSLFLPLR